MCVKLEIDEWRMRAGSRGGLQIHIDSSLNSSGIFGSVFRVKIIKKLRFSDPDFHNNFPNSVLLTSMHLSRCSYTRVELAANNKNIMDSGTRTVVYSVI